MKRSAYNLGPLTLRLFVGGAMLVTGCGDDGSADDDGADTTTTTGDEATTTDTEDTTTTTGEDTTTTTDTGVAESSSETGAGACAPIGIINWEAPDWEANTATEAAVRQLLFDLAGGGIMEAAEQDEAVLTVDDLNAQFEMGTPSLADVTHAGFLPIVEQSFAEFAEVDAAGVQDLVTIGDTIEWTPGDQGGIWGSSSRGINENGLELRQIVDKGLFSAGAFYWHALNLTEGTITPATIDQIAYIWGGTETMELVEDDLEDAANYAFDHGFFGLSVQALADAKVFAARDECEAERDAALVTFFGYWEAAMMARLVYYVNAMAVGLTTATAQDDYAAALHAAAEGVGLLSGFYGLPDTTAGPLMGQNRVITDGEIDAIMAEIGVDLSDLSRGTFGNFTESLVDFETAQAAVEEDLVEIYSLDVETVAGWRVEVDS